jgi:hypothetical protein
MDKELYVLQIAALWYETPFCNLRRFVNGILRLAGVEEDH